MRKINISILAIVAILMLLAGSALAGIKTITLGWDYPSNVSDLAGFRVYQSNISGQYDMSKPALVVSDTTARQATLPNPLTDGTYYWVMTAFDKAGNESVKSAELKYDLDATAPPIPGTLRVVVSVTVTQ